MLYNPLLFFFKLLRIRNLDLDIGAVRIRGRNDIRVREI